MIHHAFCWPIVVGDEAPDAIYYCACGQVSRWRRVISHVPRVGWWLAELWS